MELGRNLLDQQLIDSRNHHMGKVDGVVHAIGFMPADGLGGNFLNTPWESVAFGFQTSAYSLKALSVGLLEPMKAAGAASVVSLTFDGRFAWPIYDWMGVAKAGLESERSEERRVGKECRLTCRSRWSPYH